MTRLERTRTLVYVGLGVAALVALAAGLSGLELHPGRLFPDLGAGAGGTEPGLPAPDVDVFESLVRGVLALVFWVLLPLSIVYFIVSPEARRRVLQDLKWLIPVMLMVYLIVHLLRQLRLRDLGVETPRTLESASSGGPPLPVPPAFVSHPPGWLITLVSVAVFALILGAFWLLWQRSRRRTDDSLTRLAQEAEVTLDALRAGGDVRNAVLRCYGEMQRVLRESHGIRRRRSMTPREFEDRLAAAGLSSEHVRRLTRLFEAVRYGAHVPRAREEREAEDCLESIVRTYGGRAAPL